MLSEELWSEITTIAPFLLADDKCARALSAWNTHSEIIDAMKRQLALRTEGGVFETMEIESRTFDILDKGLEILM